MVGERLDGEDLDDEELVGQRLTSRNAAFRADPHHFYDRLRERGQPVVDDEYQRLIVTDYPRAREVIRHKGFGVDARRAAEGSYMRTIAGTGVLEGRGDNAYEPPLVLLDDPAHRRIRLLVSKAFNARRIDAEGPRIERITDELLDRIEGRRDVDVVADFAGPLPARVIAEILGLQVDDVGDLRQWSEDILWGYDPHRDEARQDRLRRAYSSLVGLIRTTVSERRAEPTDDLISEMVRAQQDGDRLSDLEIESLCVQLMVAGNVTTSDLMGSGLFWLASNPSQRDRLVADPSLMEQAVEEMLRYDCPITETARIAHEDADVGECPRASRRHRHRLVVGGEPRSQSFPGSPCLRHRSGRVGPPGFRVRSACVSRRAAGSARGPHRPSPGSSPPTPTTK